jgi:hypothetical protein
MTEACIFRQDFRLAARKACKPCTASRQSAANRGLRERMGVEPTTACCAQPATYFEDLTRRALKRPRTVARNLPQSGRPAAG